MLDQDTLDRLEKQLLDRVESFAKKIFPLFKTLNITKKCDINSEKELEEHVNKLINHVFHGQEEYNSVTEKWKIVKDLAGYINDHCNKLSVSSAYIHVGIFAEALDEECDMIEWHAYMNFVMGENVFE